MLIIVVACVMLGAVLFIARMDRRFYMGFRKKAADIRAQSGRVDDQALITERDLDGLPKTVKKYMIYSGALGKKRISHVHATHSGTFKVNEKMGWKPITGEYFLTAKKPSFIWYGRINLVPGLSVAAVDSYFAGQGRMNVKALSVISVADARGKETDISAFGRMLTEMTMCPTLFLDKQRAAWEAVDASSARLTFTDAGIRGSALVHFASDGAMSRIEVQRYMIMGKKISLETFEGRGSDAREFHGYRIPSYFEGAWKLTTGDFSYVRFKIESADFD